MTLQERNQQVRAFFNGKIDTYDNVHSEYMKTKVLLAESLDKYAKKILDLGGGTGLELIHLFELFPQAQVTVIDITENMLEKLKTRNFAGRVTTICGDFFEVPFGKDFDAVITTSAFHHFKKDEKIRLLKKILGCLKDGGQFINCDLIALTAEEEAAQLVDLENNIGYSKHVDIPLTIENELDALEKAGFKQITSGNGGKENYGLFIARKNISHIS
ncbi:MAG: class I SAM-dependent methyltransferase [Spirochaetaceae bacterium]|nr:class I SAM-dependent methyltransferase [Spirochaetaceae bacterium]